MYVATYETSSQITLTENNVYRRLVCCFPYETSMVEEQGSL